MCSMCLHCVHLVTDGCQVKHYQWCRGGWEKGGASFSPVAGAASTVPACGCVMSPRYWEGGASSPLKRCWRRHHNQMKGSLKNA
jgi:hypothetical protein